MHLAITSHACGSLMGSHDGAKGCSLSGVPVPMRCMAVWAEWCMMTDVVQAEYERERAARREEPGILIALYPYTPISLNTNSYGLTRLQPCSHIAL